MTNLSDRFRFTGKAQKDCTMLERWVKDKTTTTEAIRQIAKNNGWKEMPTVQQFILLAGDLGYRKELYDYEALKRMEEMPNED